MIHHLVRTQQHDRHISNYFPKVRERRCSTNEPTLLPTLLHIALNQTLLSRLDVKRSLAFYLEKTDPSKSNQLFISSDTKATTSASLLRGRHLQMPDHTSFYYSLTGLQCEGCVRAHSIWKRTSLTDETVSLSLSLENVLSNWKFLVTIRIISQNLSWISASFGSSTYIPNETVWV